MAVKGITVDTAAAASPHIYAYDQSIINNAIIGGDAVHEMFDNLLATKVSNNIVTISPGAFSIQGHFAYVQYGTTESMTIENGTAGQKRNDLICARFKRTTDTDAITLVVVKGTNDPTTPTDPTIIQQDLLTGGTERLLPLWRVSLDGINITTLTRLFTVQKNLNVFKDSLSPIKDGVYTKQDINGFRTVTVAIVYSNLSLTAASDGVFYYNSTPTLPVGCRFSGEENICASTNHSAITDVAIKSYNRSTGQINASIYSHVSMVVSNLTLYLKVTGKI